MGVLLGQLSQLAVKQETKASFWVTLGNMGCSPLCQAVSAAHLNSRYMKVIKKYLVSAVHLNRRYMKVIKTNLVSAVHLNSRHMKVIKMNLHLITVFLQCRVSIVWGLQDRIGSPLRDTCKKLVPLARPSVFGGTGVFPVEHIGY